MIDVLVFIHLLILSSLWCFGFHVVFKKLILKTILEYDLDENWDGLSWFAKFALKPLFACPPCMASVHGTAIHFLNGGDPITWIPFVVCLCGLNYVISMAVE